MADYIDREELLKKMFYPFDETCEECIDVDSNLSVVSVEDIKSMPSVDAVEVVRCKDCKKRNSLKYCERHDFFISDDYYCASGVKKNE